jgi:hypothetical protein
MIYTPASLRVLFPVKTSTDGLHKECITMAALAFPCTIFQTQNRMDDYGAKDMRCGDLTEAQLKTHYHLLDVSTKANPYTLTKITPFSQPQSMFHGSRGEGEKISRQQCTNILFDEFRHLSQAFSVYGPYSHLIKQMITHMQRANGAPFRSMYLDSALREHIIRDNDSDNSTRLLLQAALKDNIDRENKIYPGKK